MNFRIPDGNLKPRKTNRIPVKRNPIKFALWLFMTIIAMIYISLIVIFYHGRSKVSLQDAVLPEIFIINSPIMMVSLITSCWAYISAKRNNLNELKAAILSTIFLGILFMNQQKKGWIELMETDHIFAETKVNSASAFFLIISCLHTIHLAVGLIFLFVTLAYAFQYKVHSKNMQQMDLSFSFWSFSVIVWLCFLMLFI
jgi:cytochrome c oxidase subunit III